MCKGSSTNTVTQQSQPPWYVAQAYQNLINRGTQVANQPLQGYQGALLAGFNPTQQAAFANINNAAGVAQPFIDQAASYAGLGAAPVWPGLTRFSGANVAQYQSPYTQQVIDTTLQNINQQNQIDQNSLVGRAIASGSDPFGGDRAGVAAAELARNQELAKNQVIAGLENQGYSQALQEFNQQQGTELQSKEGDAWRAANAGYQFGGLGQEAQGTALAGASAQLQAGGLQQQLQQEQLNIPYEMYLQQQAYPFQTTNFLGSLVSGAAGGSGGTSTTTSPGPSTLSQLGGLGLAGLGIIGGTGGFDASGWLTGLLSGIGLRRGGRIPRAPIPMYENGGPVPMYDDGGAVAANPGADAPVLMGGNPLLQRAYARFQQMQPEDLHRLALMYPPSSPRGAMIRKALTAKLMAPASNAPVMRGLGGLPGMDSSGGVAGGFAAGGATGSTEPYLDNLWGTGGTMYGTDGTLMTDPHVLQAYGIKGSGPIVRSPVTGEQVSSRFADAGQPMMLPTRGGMTAPPPAISPDDGAAPPAAPADVLPSSAGADPGAAPAGDAGDDTLPPGSTDEGPLLPDTGEGGDDTEGGAPQPGLHPLPPPTLKPQMPSVAKGHPGQTRPGTPPSDETVSALLAKGATGDPKQPPVPGWALPLTVAGFAMMASRSPYPGVALGEGGLAAVRSWYEDRNYRANLAYRQAQADALQRRTAAAETAAQGSLMRGQAAQQLAQAKADAATRNGGLTPYQQQEIDLRREEAGLRAGEIGSAAQSRVDNIAQQAYDRAANRIELSLTTTDPAEKQKALDQAAADVAKRYPRSAFAEAWRSGQGGGGGGDGGAGTIKVQPLPKGVTPQDALAQARDAIKAGKAKQPIVDWLTLHGVDASGL